jgi:PhzF family phenazine biosynthesis protein
MYIQRIAAFSMGEVGGNPAGVVLCDQLPEAAVMQEAAKEIGYSETAFAAPTDGGWRVRYFAPDMEVPFCGHATIALGAALALKYGSREFVLFLNDTQISVHGGQRESTLSAELQSPATHSKTASLELIDAALRLFSLTKGDLDPRIPPAIAAAGAQHLILPLHNLDLIRSMQYQFDAGKELMLKHSLTTIALVYAQTPQRFHVRNAFASGGVYEDPATGAAAAALAGYLRDRDWPHGGHIDILQGDDMGFPSRIRADISPVPNESIRVSGLARIIE